MLKIRTIQSIQSYENLRNSITLQNIKHVFHIRRGKQENIKVS